MTKSFTEFRNAGKPTKRSSNADAVEATLLAARALVSVERGENTGVAVVLDNALFVPNKPEGAEFGATAILHIDCASTRDTHALIRKAIEAGLLPKNIVKLPGRPMGSKNKPKDAAPTDATPATPAADAAPAPVEASATPAESAPATVAA